MARQLSSIPNIDPANGAYPAGKIRNDNPPAEGTPVTEELYGDIIQFFHKLMRLAGLTYNDLAENETTGFQFIQALAFYMRTLAASATEKGVVELATNAETQAGLDALRAITPAGLKSLIDTLGDIITHNAAEFDAAGAASAVQGNLDIHAALTTGAHGGIVASNDSRLTNSRACNNTFDNAETSRTALGLGDSATKNVGTEAGTVAAGDHSHSGSYDPAGSAAAAQSAAQAYALANGGYLLARGSKLVGDIASEGSEITVNDFGILGTTNYMVDISIFTHIPGQGIQATAASIITERSASQFKVWIKKLSSTQCNLSFHYRIYSLD